MFALSSILTFGCGKLAAASKIPSIIIFFASFFADPISTLFNSVAVFIKSLLSFLKSSSIFIGSSGYGGK